MAYGCDCGREHFEVYDECGRLIEVCPDDDLPQCEYCGEPAKALITTTDGDRVCWPCYEREGRFCAGCENEIGEQGDDPLPLVNGRRLCEDCQEDEAAEAKSCAKWMRVNYLIDRAIARRHGDED